MKAWWIAFLLMLVLAVVATTIIACGDDDDDDDDDTDDGDDDNDDDDDSGDDDDDETCEPVDDPMTNCTTSCSAATCAIVIECGVFGEQTSDQCIEGCLDLCGAGCLPAGMQDCFDNYTTCAAFDECLAPLLD
jgi:hypothetical protein